MTQLCGGSWRMNVYQTYKNDIKIWTTERMTTVQSTVNAQYPTDQNTEQNTTKIQPNTPFSAFWDVTNREYENKEVTTEATFSEPMTTVTVKNISNNPLVNITGSIRTNQFYTGDLASTDDMARLNFINKIEIEIGKLLKSNRLGQA